MATATTNGHVGKRGGRGGTGPGSAQRERGLRPERPVTRSGRWRGGRGRDTGTRAGVARAPAAGWGLPSGIVGDREEGKEVERNVPRASGAALPVRLPPSLAFSYYFLGFKKTFLFSIFFSLYLLYFHFSFFCFVLFSFFFSSPFLLIFRTALAARFFTRPVPALGCSRLLYHRDPAVRGAAVGLLAVPKARWVPGWEYSEK